MGLAIVLITLLVSILTGYFVYQKNPKSATHVYFGLLVIFISAYPVINFLAVNATNNDTARFWSKFILLVSIPQGPLLYFFAKTFPASRYYFNKKKQLIIITWASLNILFAFLGLIFKSVAVQDKKVSIQPGPLIPSFGILHVSTIVGGIYVLYKKYKSSAGIARRQMSIIFYGILTSFTLMFLITFILPIFLKNTLLLAISPLVLSLSVLSVAYAIIRLRLFDIKAAAARGLGYLATLGFIGLTYGVLVFLIATIFGIGDTLTNEQRAIFIALALFTAFIFPYSRKFFDRLSNNIFYRDAYDPQAFLDQLNKNLVSNVEINSLLAQSAQIIEANLKPEFCSFYIRDTAYVAHRNIGDAREELNDKQTAIIDEQLKNYKHKVVLTDSLIEMPELQEVHKVLRENNIGILARLVTNPDMNLVGAGYILLGFKKSGNPYSDQDLQIIDIITNELVIAIQNALRFEEIEKFNITLQHKVDDATRELRKTNQKLKTLDETKDEFISMASHQLRTPLTSVKGYLSMVLEGDVGEITEQQRKMLDQAYVSSQRMVYLIADLLNVSRLRTGKFVIETSPTDLAEVIAGEVSQLVETASARGLEITFNNPENFPSLMIDETKIRQVIMNFIDNAIYYTPSGGHIKVNLTDNGQSIEFTVIDDGIGVPRSEQHHMFTKFYRAGNARKARPDGTGLGLFMAKKVIVAQGGAIIFKSEEGKGSTFGFTFAKTKLAVDAKS
jgi:signal transduction histidine kinase